MDTGSYLAKVAGDKNPRRCFVRETDPDALLGHAMALYRISCDRVHRAFRIVLDHQDEIVAELGASEGGTHTQDQMLVFNSGRLATLTDAVFDELRFACYPYVALLDTDVTEKVSFLKPFDPTPVKDTYRSSLGNPEVLHHYFHTEIGRLTETGLTLEVGLDLAPIPLPIAIDRPEFGSLVNTLKIGERRLIDYLQTAFPMPSVVEIEDSTVDGTLKARRQSDVVNREYRFFNSLFWMRYLAFLRDGEWRQARWDALVANVTPEIGAQWHARRGPGVWPPRHADTVTDRAPTTPDAAPEPRPLANFDGLRADHSLLRLKHYTLTDPAAFQDYILFSNYRQYVDKFIFAALTEIDRRGGGALVCSAEQYSGRGQDGSNQTIELAQAREILARIKGPDDQPFDRKKLRQEVPDSDAQMPAYHYIPAENSQTPDEWAQANNLVWDRFGSRRNWLNALLTEATPLPGVSLVQIGVGSSNARNITDHLAVLRPKYWVMVGHCGGIRRHQKIGDYVIAHGYMRRDTVLDEEVPLDVPLPAVEEIQQALREAVETTLRQDGVYGLEDYRDTVRTGTVYTTNNRNWETAPAEAVVEEFEKSRAIAVDMESATIAANGYRYRIPYGAILCVSDKPLHGAIKMRFLADDFYRSQIDRHLDIVLKYVQLLAYDETLRDRLSYTRKLRGLDDPPFR